MGQELEADSAHSFIIGFSGACPTTANIRFTGRGSCLKCMTTKCLEHVVDLYRLSAPSRSLGM